MVYNEQFARNEFSISGEDRLLEGLKGNLNTILDVGSNIGEWTRMAREFHPDADIHSFEIVPNTYKKQLDNIKPDSKTFLNGFGLSNEAGTLPMQHATQFDAMSSCLAELHVEASVWVDGLVLTGDQYVRSRQIDYVDFLKIDVEGGEDKVIHGFADTFNAGKIGIVLFEYGYANVLSRFLLVDAYKMLMPLGYHIGKLTGDKWAVGQYNLLHENFQGPNILAVHDSKMHLMQDWTVVA